MKPLPTVQHIYNVVYRETGVPATDIIDGGRTDQIREARQAFVVACRLFTIMSFPDIAVAMGRSTRHSVAHAAFRRREKPATKRVVERLKAEGYTIQVRKEPAAV